MNLRKEMKKQAKQVVRKHWFLLVFVCMISGFLASENVSSMLGIRNADTQTISDTGEYDADTQTADGTVDEDTSNSTDAGAGTSTGSSGSGLLEGDRGLVDVINSINSGNVSQGKELSEQLLDKEKQSDDGPMHAFGRTDGVLAMLINGVTSGSIYVMIFSGINSLIGSENAAVFIMVLLSLLLVFSVWYLIKNVYIVISRRIFLECRTYEKVGMQKFMFLFQVKKWFHTAKTMFVVYVYQVLWFFTIIGGFIKHYSYFMVPYIAAENPEISTKDAIGLSRRMMNGHKWECFVCELTFLGWKILGYFTLGISNILYTNPYKTAFFSEYYANLRHHAKAVGIKGAVLLNDRYLYEKADEKLLRKVYREELEASEQQAPEQKKKNGILGFLAEYFGIILFAGKQEEVYEEQEVRKLRTSSILDVVDGKMYPRRLSPVEIVDKNRTIDKNHYMRHYSICSLIMLFFSFSIIGWIWEVSLHLVSDGVFVNRGVLQGPWLPIYGSGGVLILILLAKFREKPLLEFSFATILCGLVEYFTAYHLELTHNGQKWWDYSGYFLNLHGRICAEGLLVFGLGGMVIVYIVAPRLDELFKKIKLQILIPVCAVLLCLYITDQAYSSRHPNTGKGITSASRIEMQENPRYRL